MMETEEILTLLMDRMVAGLYQQGLYARRNDLRVSQVHKDANSRTVKVEFGTDDVRSFEVTVGVR